MVEQVLISNPGKVESVYNSFCSKF